MCDFRCVTSTYLYFKHSIAETKTITIESFIKTRSIISTTVFAFNLYWNLKIKCLKSSYLRKKTCIYCCTAINNKCGFEVFAYLRTWNAFSIRNKRSFCMNYYSCLHLFDLTAKFHSERIVLQLQCYLKKFFIAKTYKQVLIRLLLIRYRNCK